MKIAEIKRDNFAFLKPIEDNFVRLNQVNAYLYIENLGRVSQTDIKDWNLLEIFGLGTDINGVPTIYANKNEINKLFFSHKLDAAPPIRDIPEDDLAKLEKMKTYFMRRRTQTLERQVNECMAVIQDRTRIIHEKFEQLHSYRRQLREITGVAGSDLARSLEPVYKNPFFKTITIEGDYISLITEDVILWEKNPAIGLNYGVNLGQFQILAYPDRMKIQVFAYSNNTHVRNHSHPHLGSSADGYICLGNMEAALYKAVDNGDVGLMIDICAQVIQNYNPGNPYVALTGFWWTAQPTKRHGQLYNEFEKRMVIGGAGQPVPDTTGLPPEEEEEEEDTDEDEAANDW